MGGAISLHSATNVALVPSLPALLYGLRGVIRGPRSAISMRRFLRPGCLMSLARFPLGNVRLWRWLSQSARSCVRHRVRVFRPCEAFRGVLVHRLGLHPFWEVSYGCCDEPMGLGRRRCAGPASPSMLSLLPACSRLDSGFPGLPASARGKKTSPWQGSPISASLITTVFPFKASRMAMSL